MCSGGIRCVSAAFILHVSKRFSLGMVPDDGVLRSFAGAPFLFVGLVA